MFACASPRLGYYFDGLDRLVRFWHRIDLLVSERGGGEPARQPEVRLPRTLLAATDGVYFLSCDYIFLLSSFSPRFELDQ
jgi:hypothetical protein